MQGEHLNTDGFSVLALFKKKKNFYGNRKDITAVKLQFCFIIRSFKKTKSQHSNLGLLISVRVTMSCF